MALPSQEFPHLPFNQEIVKKVTDEGHIWIAQSDF
jgi:hypothetical protein